MKTFTRKLQFLSLTAALSVGFTGNALATLDLSGANFVTYGDANSYALQVEGVIAGSTGPGSLYYVNSTPGAIQDLIVVATGATGTNVTTNFAGMDDALSTPNGTGSSNFFSDIWSSTLAAFTTFAGSNPLFFFNNNQTKRGEATNENLAVWAQISLTGKAVNPEDQGPETFYFDFTNRNSPYALFTEGGGGDFNGNLFPPSSYTSTGAGPIAGTNGADGATDYVLSGGAICLNELKVPVSCTSAGAVGKAIDNNLGANQAAYAIQVPELDAFLAAWIKKEVWINGIGTSLDTSLYSDINIDLRFGCDPDTSADSCLGRSANNGYEQLFIGTADNVIQVPEPNVLALLGLGFLGMFSTLRRKK